MHLIEEIYQDDVSFCKSSNQIEIVSKVFPIALHKKWEHQLGLYHIIDLSIDAGFIRTKKKLSLKVAALLHSIGHAFLSRPTEEALIYILNENNNKQQLYDRYNNVTDYIGCSDCKYNCIQKMLEKYEFENIHRWETALILLEKNVSFNEAKKNNSNLMTGISLQDIIRSIICKKSDGFEVLNYLDKVDYVLRDLHYLGLLRFKVNLQYLFLKNKNKDIKDISELELIYKQLFEYLNVNIYTNEKVILITRLFQKLFINNMTKNNISLSSVKRIRNLDVNDEYKDVINNIEIADEYQVPISIIVHISKSKNLNNLKIEKELLPVGWDFVNYVDVKKLMVAVTNYKNTNKKINIYVNKSLNTFSNILDLLLSIKRFLKTMNNISATNTHKYNAYILKCLLNEEVNINIKKFEEIISKLIYKFSSEQNPGILINSFSYVMKIKNDINDEEDDIFRIVIDSIRKHEINEFENVIKNKEKKDSEVVTEFINFIIENTELFAKDGNCKVVLEYLLSELKKSILNKDEDAEVAIELLVYLSEVLKKKEGDEESKWIMPCVIIGDNKREVDCIIIERTTEIITVEFIEVTLTKNDGKTIDDLSKNQKIIDDIGQKYKDIKTKKRVIAPEQNILIQTIGEFLKN